jgi:hypothetical protein
MSRPEEISLRIGAGRWLRVAQAVASLLGVAAILLSPCAPHWTAIALAALGFVHLATARRLRRAAAEGVVTLHGDDSATILAAGEAVPLRRRGGDWASRWCCVLRLEAVISGRRIDGLICRSLNDPVPYRRLLVRLRMREARIRDTMHLT